MFQQKNSQRNRSSSKLVICFPENNKTKGMRFLAHRELISFYGLQVHTSAFNYNRNKKWKIRSYYNPPNNNYVLSITQKANFKKASLVYKPQPDIFKL